MKDKTVLVTRPRYEPTTNYLYHWSKALIDTAKARGAKVLDVAAEKVVRKEFEGRVDKMAPNLIHLNGHGTSLSVLGHNNEAILDETNIAKVKDAVVYALSCDSAAKLGATAVTKGAKAYVGYTQEFIFFVENRKKHQPLEDTSAAFFLKPAMKVTEELLKGKTIEDTLAIAKKAFDESILEASSSEVHTGYSNYVRYLLWDKKALIAHGEPNTTI